MNVLVCIATKLESKKILAGKEVETLSDNLSKCSLGKVITDILVTGPGGYFTMYHLLNTLKEKKYDLAINAGIAGSYNKEIAVGEVVQVVSDEFADLGIEDKDHFITIFEAGFENANKTPFRDGKLYGNTGNFKYKILDQLTRVSAITSATAHGGDNSIEKCRKKFAADIETMEGAAFFYTCLLQNVPCMQLRSISNRVEPRNLKNWNTELALENLSKDFLSLLHEINEQIK